ncbi:MAG TPA: DUF488 domain-containing protein [Kofleriaceae bacterium]|nr:DUF488 domain-containing protein [Kofleriaceae bacterium]
MQVYSIGHSTRTLDELRTLLRVHGVRTLADIRSIRRSRTNPQFDEPALRKALGRRYVVIDELGGRRGKPKRPPRLANDAWDHPAFRNYADHALTAEFRAGLARLLRLPGPVAIMCAEAVWWRCHRRIVADHLLARGVPVAHILSERPAAPATLTPFAVVTRGRVHYPRNDRTASSRRSRHASADCTPAQWRPVRRGATGARRPRRSAEARATSQIA